MLMKIAAQSVAVSGGTLIVQRTAVHPTLAKQELHVRLVIAIQSLEVLCKMSRRTEITNVDERSRRHPLRVVSCAEDYRNDIQMINTKELFGDVIIAETVLERKVELVGEVQESTIAFCERPVSVHIKRTPAAIICGHHHVIRTSLAVTQLHLTIMSYSSNITDMFPTINVTIARV